MTYSNNSDEPISELKVHLVDTRSDLSETMMNVGNLDPETTVKVHFLVENKWGDETPQVDSFITFRDSAGLVWQRVSTYSVKQFVAPRVTRRERLKLFFSKEPPVQITMSSAEPPDQGKPSNP